MRAVGAPVKIARQSRIQGNIYRKFRGKSHYAGEKVTEVETTSQDRSNCISVFGFCRVPRNEQGGTRPYRATVFYAWTNCRFVDVKDGLIREKPSSVTQRTNIPCGRCSYWFIVVVTPQINGEHETKKALWGAIVELSVEHADRNQGRFPVVSKW